MQRAQTCMHSMNPLPCMTHSPDDKWIDPSQQGPWKRSPSHHQHTLFFFSLESVPYGLHYKVDTPVEERGESKSTPFPELVSHRKWGGGEEEEEKELTVRSCQAMGLSSEGMPFQLSLRRAARSTVEAERTRLNLVNLAWSALAFWISMAAVLEEGREGGLKEES